MGRVLLPADANQDKLAQDLALDPSQAGSPSPEAARGAFIVCERLDLESTLDGGQAFRWHPDPEWSGGYRGVIGRRALRIAPAPGGVRVESADGRDIGPWIPRIRNYLGLDDGFEAFRARYAGDDRIGPALAGWLGLRVLRQDPWECLVAFITSATSNIPRIKLNVGSIAVACGNRVGPGAHDFSFPAAEAVAEAGENRLRELGLGFRAKYVAAAAEEVARGNLVLGRLAELSYLDAREALMSLEGVGEKIADCVLAFSLGKGQAFPVDRWTRRALVEWYGMPPTLNNSKAADWARDRFGEDSAYVQQYLFHRQRLTARDAPRKRGAAG